MEKQNKTGNLFKTLGSSVIAKVFMTAILLYIFSGIVQPNYFSYKYLSNTLVTASFLGLLTVGQSLVILTGGIDLSIVITMNLAAVITSKLAGGSLLYLLLVLLATGIVIGALNAFGIVFLKVPPIVMTLAMQSIVTSAMYLYTNGIAEGAAPKVIKTIGTGSVGKIRIMLIVWVLIACLITFLLQRTTFGRKLYALGNSESVAYYSGVQNTLIIFLVYILSSVFAVLCGLLYTGYLGYAYLGMGSSFLMLSIAAVVIGGTSINGGKGSYAGTIAGCIILYILDGLLTSLNMSQAVQNIIYGCIILGVLLLYGREKSVK